MASGENKMGIIYGAIVVAALGAFIITFYQKERAPSSEERTAERAQLVGKSLIAEKFEQKVFLPAENKQDRGLASTTNAPNEVVMVTRKNLSGEVGRDAWGKPFHFQVKGDGISNSTLYIWSYGANGNPDFKEAKDLIASGAKGDDILVSIAF